ncbi:hypothetical protein PoB_000074700 [Plakobranchus ocellatus]|uniref:Uncharacterized protein n=1 Tax=Plakobranchus ocellatus TaxID=259542 RepID=A0AAV3XWL2_9GAST|nr:hypothetical protein PoB_000074700 [Plakobranchus ocellatus]
MFESGKAGHRRDPAWCFRCLKRVSRWLELTTRGLQRSNSKRSSHPDKNSCFQTHKMVQDMIKLYGIESSTFLSVDDKWRVSIGLIEAPKQAPLMMHVEYKVKLCKGSSA